MANYIINEAYIERYKTAIDRDEVINVEIRDEKTRSFRNVKAMLSSKEQPGWEKVTPVFKVNFQPKGEDLFIKILEDLPEEEEPLCVSESPWQWNKV